MPKKRPNLKWKTSDYEKNGFEPPEELLRNPGETEGGLMDESDIENWVLDSIKVFKIIKEEDEKVFKELYKNFVQDIKYLEKIGKVDKKAAENILNKDIFEF